MTAIRNYVNGLNRTLAWGKYDLMPKAVKGIDDQVARAGEIIRRLRDFVQKGTPSQQEEYLAEIVEDAISLVSIGPTATGVSFHVQLDEQIRRVLVDRTQIQQALFNLMRNAVQAMDGRSQRVLTITGVLKGESLIEVSIDDTGSGIPESLLRKLF